MPKWKQNLVAQTAFIVWSEFMWAALVHIH